MVAESLGIPFYDRDLVDQVVEKLGVDRDLVEKPIPEKKCQI